MYIVPYIVDYSFLKPATQRYIYDLQDKILAVHWILILLWNGPFSHVSGLKMAIHYFMPYSCICKLWWRWCSYIHIKQSQNKVDKNYKLYRYLPKKNILETAVPMHISLCAFWAIKDDNWHRKLVLFKNHRPETPYVHVFVSGC